MSQIKVPPLGESIVDAKVSRWLKKEGETVAAGDTLVELETDKITVEVPAPRAGAITKVAAQEGAVVKVGDVLADFDESAVGSDAGAAAPARPTPPRTAPVSAGSAPASATGDGVKSSPAARRAATEAGIDVATVTGSGRGGVVSKPDVLERAATAAPPAPPAPPPSTPPPPPPPPVRAAPVAAGERETRENMSTRRKRIAENLLQSQHSTAHLTTFNEIDMSAV